MRPALQKIRIGLLLASIKLGRVYTHDREYKRDSKGRFATTGTPGSTEGKIKRYDPSRKHKPIRLPPSERRMVESNLNTHLTKEQRKKFIIKKAIRNFLYTVENYGFDNYNIIDKVELD